MALQYGHSEKAEFKPAVAPLMPTELSRPDCLRALFGALDQQQVRYCVLHSWGDLPEELPSDLDIAVHPHDRAKLSVVFGILGRIGFTPVQCQYYEAKGYAFVFFWFHATKLSSLHLDVIFEYRHEGLILSQGENLVLGRRVYNSFWIADPSIAFRYLLAKKAIKGSISPCQQEQLRELAGELGRSAAVRITADLFGERWKTLVVDACLNGNLPCVIPQLAGPLRRTLIAGNPINPITYFVGDCARLLKRWLRPTGLFVIILGPDGVGKSTLVGRLGEELRAAFGRQRLFHFRPQFVLPRKEGPSPTYDPQGVRSRGRVGSVGQLCVFVLDYWIGYILSIRPFVARSGLVICDRYFHDLTIDTKRYRYGGPRWLVRLLSHCVPPFGPVVLVLDADVDVVLSRKREIAADELKRLRTSYCDFALKTPSAALINADKGLEETVLAALRAISLHLAERFERRHSSWLAGYDPAAHEGKAAEVAPR